MALQAPFKGRREDRRFLTGSGRYTADCNLMGQVHAFFLRSDRAHARIKSVECGEAQRMPGVLAVLTGADAMAAKLVAPPSLLKEAGRGGARLINPRRFALATDTVRYVGEAVAMVVAVSEYAAVDAAERIEVLYEDLPAVVDIDDALALGAALVHEDVPGNVCLYYEYGDAAAVEGAFRQAHHVARVDVDSQRVAGNPMEPRACLVAWRRVDDSYDIYCSTQGGGPFSTALAAFSNVPQDRIRAHFIDVGGAFGVRIFAYPEYVMAMLASKRIGRPVKWVGSRAESLMTDYHGRAQRMEGRLAVDRDGRFLAIRVDFKCDQGAYPSESGAVVSVTNARFGVTGGYRIPHAYGLHRLVMTNTCPTGAYRGAGRPDIAYLVEQLVDQAARDLSVDRMELRRRNFVPAEMFPYTTPLGVVYDTADFAGLLERALQEADWAGFERRRQDASVRGCLLGFGLAAFIERAGGGIPKDQVAVRFEGDGIAVYTVSGPSGQGHETVFPEIFGNALGIRSELIRFVSSDPMGPALVGGGTMGSRSGFSLGSAMLAGAREVVKKAQPLAAQALEAAPEDVEFLDGVFSVKGTDRRIGLMELAASLSAREGHPLDALGEVSVGATFPSGVHVAEVEVDPDTGEARVTQYVAIDDCGRILNHALLEGQLHGGIVQAAGQALGEHVLYDRESGQMLSATYMDYFMPRADLMPPMRLIDRSIPTPVNELGAKGAGEAGTTGGLAAIACGVKEAIRLGGVERFDLPATPQRIWQALRIAKGAAGGHPEMILSESAIRKEHSA